jgi:hypothetical protein
MPMPLTDFVLFSGVGSSSRLLACSVEEATPPSIAPTLNRGSPRPGLFLGHGQHEDRTPIYGYEPTREAAMAAFAKSWRRE